MNSFSKMLRDAAALNGVTLTEFSPSAPTVYAPAVAVVGDALFAGSMGRGFQSWELAKQKIREQIFTLPPATLICPGHGPLTTVAEEEAHNAFF